MVSLNTVFELLSDERRRHVLYYLRDHGGEVSVEELIDTVAEWETNTPPPAIPDEFLAELELELQHVHLPKASTVEFIEYVPEDGVVRIRGAPSEFTTVVTVARLIERPTEE
ncbi:hypothetical protein HALLA_12995 [Halostagnicola larsenii XH-48]|uniref:DUF7344 domain-containing protein n=1 Tax=Halostagnicola larsenii XH-48 TaxID=797299 RepID=W0JQX0_9EURY|nr:hypothetical protein [Halostagnicola larsenii]AHF99569.1 hypothetical protein HALLA_12995 [Halostagnicola larsenii XH-48]